MEKITQKSTFPKRNVGFHPSFSRHGITRASSVLLIWLNENVGFHPSFSRHGITRASSVLLIWLNENVHKRVTTCPLFREKYVPLQWNSATMLQRLCRALGGEGTEWCFSHTNSHNNPVYASTRRIKNQQSWGGTLYLLGNHPLHFLALLPSFDLSLLEIKEEPHDNEARNSQRDMYGRARSCFLRRENSQNVTPSWPKRLAPSRHHSIVPSKDSNHHDIVRYRGEILFC